MSQNTNIGKKTLQQHLVDLHIGLVQALEEKIATGEASASDFREARELLKQNSITADASDGSLEALKASISNDSDFEEDMLNGFNN